MMVNNDGLTSSTANNKNTPGMIVGYAYFSMNAVGQNMSKPCALGELIEVQ